MKIKNILTVQNAKTTKGESKGYLTGILYLAPSNTVQGINTCPFATEGCKKSCLYTAGRGKFSNVQKARINKTILFRDNREAFFESLIYSINQVIKQAKKKNLIPVIRLNGTSDISWEVYKIKDNKNVFELFPMIQFYDYTKNPYRINKAIANNYHLTFSGSNENLKILDNAMQSSVNVALVFKDKLPETYKGRQVISGDETDLRFLDAPKKVVGLIAKGDAKKDLTGFVIQ